MDREPQELQFVGFLGIFREAYKIIFTWKRIFTQITLSLILPLSLIFLTHLQVSELLFGKIINNEVNLDYMSPDSSIHKKISDRLSSEWTFFWIFKAAYLLFVLVLSLLCTSACVYTIACIYTAKDITFKKVMSVVPKVWKRLMITFLWNFLVMVGYNIAAITLLVLWIAFIRPVDVVVAIVTLVILGIVYFVGFVYINTVWNLASVVSVLEDSRGYKAMIKSKKLIKGKIWVSCAIFVTFQVLFFMIGIGFSAMVGFRGALGVVSEVFLGILCVLLLSKLILLGLVAQTVVYFVCKSYHHESIDKSCLADHLEVYLGDYVPLKSKDVQLMNKFEV